MVSSLATAPPHYLIAYTDGGARGNPGPAGFGVVLQDETGRKITGLSQYLGHQTNNVAEYQGLIAALEYAVEHGPRALKVISDSELLVKQIRGEYKVRNPTLQDLHARARQLIRQLEWFSIQHVLRGHNAEADRLANAAMDKGMGRGNTSTLGASASATQLVREFEGIVDRGVIRLTNGDLPDGTRVEVRVKR